MALRQGSSPNKKHRLRRRLWLVGLAVFFCLVLVSINIAVILRPERLRQEIHAQLKKVIAVEYSIVEIETKLFAGEVRATGIVVENPEGCHFPSAMEIQELNIRISLSDLLRGELVIQEINLDSPHIYVEVGATGNTNLERLFKPRPKDQKKKELQLPAINITDLELQLRTDDHDPLGEALKMKQVSLKLPKARGEDFELIGRAALKSVGAIRFSGKGNFKTDRYSGNLKIAHLDLNEDFRTRIPKNYHEIWDRVSPVGYANLELELAYDSGKWLRSEGTIELLDVGMQLDDTGLSLDSMTGIAKISATELEIVQPFKGIASKGLASLEGKIAFDQGGLTSSDIQLELSDVRVVSKIERYLSGDLSKLWKKLDPKGAIGLKAHFGGESFPPEILDSTLVLKDVSLGYDKLPYRLEAISGQIDLKKDRLIIPPNSKLSAKLGASSVKIWGDFPLDQEEAFDLQAQVTGFPLDRTLERSMPEQTLRRWKMFQPNGMVDAHLHSFGNQLDPEFSISAKLYDASMLYDLFPYPMKQIEGEIEFQHFPKAAKKARSNVLTVGRLQAYHDSTYVYVDQGLFSWGNSPFRMDLQIRCPRLPVEEHLIRALPIEARDDIRSFNLRGELDTTVEIFTLSEKEGLDVRTTVNMLAPTHFKYDPLPYPLQFIRGQAIHSMSTKTVQLDGFETDSRHGPHLVASGSFGPDESGDPNRKRLDLILSLGAWEGGRGLPVDRQLIDALPAELKSFFEKIGAKGVVAGDLLVGYRYRTGVPDEERENEVEYGGDINVYNGAVKLGVDFTDITAELSFSGEASPSHPHSFSGTAFFDEIRLSRFWSRKDKVSFAFGQMHEAIALAKERKFVAPYGGKFIFPNHFLAKIRPDNVSQLLQIHLEDGQLYGGKTEGFITANLVNEGEITVDLRADDMDLSQGSRDIFRKDGVVGEANGYVRFHGPIKDANGLKGQGQFNISKAKLMKLPAVAHAISSVINLQIDGGQKTRHIHSAKGSFRIRNGKFIIDDWDKLVLASSVLKIKCHGMLTFDQKVDLYLDPQFILDYIPLVSNIVKTFKLIHLTGDIDEPGMQYPSIFIDPLTEDDYLKD